MSASSSTTKILSIAPRIIVSPPPQGKHGSATVPVAVVVRSNHGSATVPVAAVLHMASPGCRRSVVRCRSFIPTPSRGSRRAASWSAGPSVTCGVPIAFVDASSSLACLIRSPRPFGGEGQGEGNRIRPCRAHPKSPSNHPHNTLPKPPRPPRNTLKKPKTNPPRCHVPHFANTLRCRQMHRSLWSEKLGFVWQKSYVARSRCLSFSSVRVRKSGFHSDPSTALMSAAVLGGGGPTRHHFFHAPIISDCDTLSTQNADTQPREHRHSQSW